MNLRRCFLLAGICCLQLVFLTLVPRCTLRAADKNLPDHLTPRRSSQIKDGFGINSDLPRDPFIPWNRWWWTRMFDAGVNFIRIEIGRAHV